MESVLQRLPEIVLTYEQPNPCHEKLFPFAICINAREKIPCDESQKT